MTPSLYDQPIGFDEMAARLKSAATSELWSINQLECFAARAEGEALRLLTVAEARRQAEALGLAHKVALALARQPALARGLGLSEADMAGLA